MGQDKAIAHAGAEAATRQARATRDRWTGVWRWLPPALLVTVGAAFLAMPRPLPEKLLFSMGGVCSLRPSHSYFMGGLQLPLEARMTGIWGAFTLTLLTLLGFRRLGARRLGGKVVLVLLGVGVASMVADGVNSTLAEFGTVHLYTPTNGLRLLTGLLSGIAIATGWGWVFGTLVSLDERDLDRAVVRSPWELLVPLVLSSIFGLIVLSGAPRFYYPVALLSTGGVVWILGSVMLVTVLIFTDSDDVGTPWRRRIAPWSVALLLALTILGSVAMGRWTFLGALQG